MYLANKGYQVKGFSRNITPVESLLTPLGIELEEGNLCDPQFVNQVMKGARFVIHLAALSSPWGKYKDFYSVNVEGTQNICISAQRNGVARVVHVSTPSLYFDFRDRYQVLEDEKLPKRGVNHYATTKKMAENIVDEFVQQGGEAITLRPRAVFGPHDKTLLPRVLRVCREKGILQFTPKSPVIDVTYVENLAHALFLALEAPRSCVGQKYNITNGEPIPFWDLLENLLTKLSIPIQTKSIPYPLAYSAAFLSEWKSRLSGKEPLLTRYSLGVLSYSQTLSIEKARNELHYSPTIPLEEGVSRYVNWIQNT